MALNNTGIIPVFNTEDSNVSVTLGFEGDGVTCNDIDESASNEDNCDNNADCLNNEGGFDCDCKDVNECVTDMHNCDNNASCDNIIGSFSCKCNDDYEGDGVTCLDIDECVGADGIADECDSATTECHNLDGTYECYCLEGYDRRLGFTVKRLTRPSG